MEELGYNNHMIGLAKERVNELQQRGVVGIGKFVQKLTDRVNDTEAYLDILMEGRFAIILSRNNFSKIQIEYADSGPDLKAVWNRNTVYFEVTRRHPKEEDKLLQSEDAITLSATKVEIVIERIKEKLEQLESGEMNVVVYWSGTATTSLFDMRNAFNYIQQENNQTPKTYGKLGGILFTEDGAFIYDGTTPTPKQFYLFRNDNALRPLGTRLANKLESLHEEDLKKLQKEDQELADALRKQLAKKKA